MRNLYQIFQRIIPLFAVAFILLFLVHAQVVAQQRIEMYEVGILRIKVSEEMAVQLENARVSRSANNILVTGIQSIDNVNQQYGVRDMKRVFRPAGKFEEKHKKYGLHRWYEIKLDTTVPVLEAIAAFGRIQHIEIAEPVYKKAIVGSNNPGFGPRVVKTPASNAMATLPGTSNDPFLPNQWHYNNTGQSGGTPGADIKLLQAWAVETGSSDVIVAITDGGVQVDHPDLAANMWVNIDEIPGNGIDDDNNGFIDDVNGYGFGDDTGEIAPDNHGSHVGGTVAAVTNNGIGVAGVAGGSGIGDGARIMSCAAFGAVSNGGFAETYVYAADMGAVISQNSWGYTNPGAFEQAVLDGIDYFIAEAGRDEFGTQVGPMNGGIVIFAAGNDDTDNQWYPGFYDATLAVSAVTHNDTKAWYSNFGSWVDIAAPGGETNTVANQGVASTLANGQYGFFQGTSMACPHVSGVAALVVSQIGGPGFTPTMLRDRLLQTTDNIDAADSTYAGLLGIGRLNAFAALQEDDGLPPEPINDLSESDVSITSITLNWTAPADPGNGSASSYDLRYSTDPIDASNFDGATAVSNPPSAMPAGSAESYTVTGLTGGTVYYFAIKSIDLFGNVSAISNVVEQATAFPPVGSISVTSLSDDLVTAATSSQVLEISNSGAGQLEFLFVYDSTSFVEVEPSSGTVAPGGTLSVDVTFDASGLLAGDYSTEIILTSNDPVTPEIVIPVTLVVNNNGAPIASIDTTSLSFGEVFVGGTSSQTLTIHNAGSDTLIVSEILLDNANFTVDVEGDVAIGAFEDAVITVSFSPLSLGAINGLLTIQTNDPTQSTFEVTLTGEGVEAPAIEVNPTALTESLNTDNTSTQFLTINNTGGSDLEIAIEIGSPAQQTSFSKEIEITIPSSGISASNINSKQTATTAINPTGKVTLKSVSQSATAYQVLIISPDDDVSDLATILNGYGDVVADIYPKISLPTLTVADMIGYDVVITSNNTPWLSAGGIDPATIGDLLADYIDQGGKVISNQFAYSYDAWQMAGRFIDENYGPFTPSTTDENIVVSLGTILSPGHPVMDSVTFLDYSGYVQNVGLSSGSVALASWDNGELFLAANDNVVALNMLPSLGNGGPLQWDGDLPTIYHNAITWLSGAGFVSVSPASATIAPGSSLMVEVAFDAAGLEAGLYESNIQILNNDPLNSIVNVPVELTVLGPEFTISPTSLDEQLLKGASVTRTLVLSNNGPDDQTYSVDVKTTGSIAMASFAQPIVKTSKMSSQRIATTETRSVTTRDHSDISGSQAIQNDNAARSKSVGRMEAQSSVEQYATGFEEFAEGDINGQNGWAGQYGNWTIESGNPASGTNHFSGLSDGFGLSASFSPEVGIGSEPLSTTSMLVNVQGSGVTWQIIPQSTTAQLVVTRIEFGANGVARALISDGSFAVIPAIIPSGYFNLSIVVERATSQFTILFDGEEVFAGEGFAGDIEGVVILSLMEVAGPTFDVDDMQIIDGGLEEVPPFITVSPLTGNLPAGQSVEISVMFDATELEFGKYGSSIVVDIEGKTELTIPATLTVYGDPAIEVFPSVMQAEVAYRESVVENFTITNTGGNPLTYNMQVIGAATDVASIPSSPVSKFKSAESDTRISEKRAKDNSTSRLAKTESPNVLQLMTGIPLLEESFEGVTFPPSGWSVVDNEGTGLVWSFAADYGEGNYSGTGEAATVSSDAAGVVEFDTELISPVIATAGYKNIAVQFNANYQNYVNLDFLDVDILVSGSSDWVNVLRWNEDHGTFRGTPGEFVTLELDEYLDGATSFQLRWHYYDPNTGDYDWYAQIDDVVVLGEARAWLAVSPASGEIPVGEEVVIDANFNAIDIEAGFYVAGILINSNAPKNPLVGVVASLNVLAPANIGVEPDSIYQELMRGESATQSITITNDGVSPLKFALGNAQLPASANGIKERVATGQMRTEPVESKLNLNDTKALINSNGKEQLAGVALYTTGFEEFSPGDINGQQGWAGQYGNWTIEEANPSEGLLHFTGLSDGFGLSLAFSPTVAIGSESISSATMMVNLDDAMGASWQIIPQSTTAQLVNTRFQITTTGTLQALVQDSLGVASYVDIAAAIPEGYFEFKIEVVRATSVFTIYFDNMPVFSGQGFAGDIEQIAILSNMEVAGPVFDLDNFAILDGQAQLPWLLVGPESGIVPAGESISLLVQLNATDLEKGTYTDFITIVSNDPDNSRIDIPVMLVVDENIAPVIDSLTDVSVVEGGFLELTFTATDADDSLVTVVAEGIPDFATLTGQANGSISYSFAPVIGDAGDYTITVVAEDGRGMMSTFSFVLSVVPYGVNAYNLINRTTGEVIATFTDSLTLDVSDPKFIFYAVNAVTNPEAVGSVLFKVNGKSINIDNNAPYQLSPLVLPLLNGGDHTLVAQAFTNKSAKGQKGGSLSATVTIVNSVSVTGLEVVNRTGKVLTSLTDGAVIDISNPNYSYINITAQADGSVGSIKFQLNGKTVMLDTFEPYSMAGDLFGRFFKWNVKPGHYTLTATPYSLPLGFGIAGTPLTVEFDVVNGVATTSKGGSNHRIGSDEVSVAEAAGISLTLYPVPTKKELSVRLSGDNSGLAELQIINSQGQVLYQKQVDSSLTEELILQLDEIGLSAGIYYLKVQTQTTRITRKFIKE